MLAIKNALLGTGSWTDATGGAATPTSNWTVVGSSDSITAGLDAVDRWAAASNLVWRNNAQAHSWIVLRQAGIAAKFEVCIALNNSDASNANASTWRAGITVSPAAGFGAANGGTDGTTLTRPTATDALSIVTPAASTTSAWGAAGTGLSDGIVNNRLHVLKSADGRSTRVLITRNNQAAALWVFEKPDNAVAAWTNPSASAVVATGTLAPSSSVLTYTNTANTAICQGRGVSSMAMFLTGEGVRPATSLLGERMSAANDLSGTYFLFPIGLYSDTGSNRGRHGTLGDVWWGLSALADSTTFPQDGSHQLVQCGALVLPWDRSLPVFT
jgi:hypothetical protein